MPNGAGSWRALARYSTSRPLPLNDLHLHHEAIMTEFSGRTLPLYYPNDQGILASVVHCRQAASLFDVSHMVQTRIAQPMRDELEKFIPIKLDQLLPEGKSRYTVLLNEQGGIFDDLIVTKLSTTVDRGEGGYLVVSNAGPASQVQSVLVNYCKGKPLGSERILLALQGPLSEQILTRTLHTEFGNLKFMNSMWYKLETKGNGYDPWVRITRCGYTGEDGFELDIPSVLQAQALIKELFQDERVRWAGLAARDILRLEAGLCLHGADLNEQITPIEASLPYTFDKRRVVGEGVLFGKLVLEQQSSCGPSIRRVGFIVATDEGKERKIIPRRGDKIFGEDINESIGLITSGGYSPHIFCGIAMGYLKCINRNSTLPLLRFEQRGKWYHLKQVALPFLPVQYKR